jgi:hypothetical protein
VLLTTSGKRWIEEGNADGTYHRSDKVASNFKYWMERARVKKPPKALRATGASKLGEHPQYKFYTTYFLGPSPTGGSREPLRIDETLEALFKYKSPLAASSQGLAESVGVAQFFEPSL